MYHIEEPRVGIMRRKVCIITRQFTMSNSKSDPISNKKIKYYEIVKVYVQVVRLLHILPL